MNPPAPVTSTCCVMVATILHEMIGLSPPRRGPQTALIPVVGTLVIDETGDFSRTGRHARPRDRRDAGRKLARRCPGSQCRVADRRARGRRRATAAVVVRVVISGL